MEKRKNSRKFEIRGWILFVCGSLVYLVDGIMYKNLLGIIGSLAFIIGCGFFMMSEKS